MKTVLAAAAIALILPGMAFAQTAAPSQTGPAATLPNTFDGPRPAAARPTPTPSPAQTQAAPVPSDPVRVAAAEAMLKTAIAAMQAGAPNYDDMSPDLAEKVRAQAAQVLPLFQQLGALQTVTHVGAQDGAELFTVVFANAQTQWIIAQNPEGKIVALLFRPAPSDGA